MADHLCGQRIVLVDPDPRLSDVVAELLRSEGVLLAEVLDRYEIAVATVREQRPDVVVVHHIGPAPVLLLVDALVRWNPAQPIVVYSSLADPELVRSLRRRRVEVVPPAEGLDGLDAAVGRALVRSLRPAPPSPGSPTRPRGYATPVGNLTW